MKNLANLIKLSECPRLSEKYKGIAALPLDLPRFELDKEDIFWEIWNREVARVDRQHIDRGALGKDSPQMTFTQWDGLAMYEDQALLSKAAWHTKMSPDLANSQPKFLESIFKSLPFVRIRSVRLWSATREVKAHYDGNMPISLDGILHFPTEVRIMINDENPTPTFWLTPTNMYNPQDKVADVDKYYINLPQDSNTFIWNNEDFLHGADYNPAYKKILVVIKGWVDVDKLEELLDRSIAKYPDFILRKE